jgi:hypothetical protein
MGQLPERHTQKLIPAAKVLSPVIAVILFNTTVKVIVVNERHNLRENIFALVHTGKFIVETL